jgi:hypothetical protein
VREEIERGRDRELGGVHGGGRSKEEKNGGYDMEVWCTW